ncbi:hypothetical protein INR49_009748 [Caranx melampygus]|nr:hypothetical protein INR49_009748 [Caranx melampygus]
MVTEKECVCVCLRCGGGWGGGRKGVHGVGVGGVHWTSCWIVFLPTCARAATQFISHPPLSTAVLSQASQQAVDIIPQLTSS